MKVHPEREPSSLFCHRDEFAPTQLIRFARCFFFMWVLLGVMEHGKAFSPTIQPAFQRYTTQDGLAHDSVYAIIQDRHNFIWMATERGLSRFDGYQFLTYEHTPLDSKSISHSSVGPLLENEDGTIWMGTWGGGLNQFSPSKETFEAFRAIANQSMSLKSDRIQSLGFDLHGNLWIGTYNGGLSRFRPETKDFDTFLSRENDPTSLPHNRVWDIQILDQHHLLIGTDNGLSKLNIPNGTFERIPFRSNNSEWSDCSRIRDLLKLPSGEFLVGTNCGLFTYSPFHQTFAFGYGQTNITVSASIRTMLQDHNGVIWIGTQNSGLFALNLEKEHLSQFVNHPRDQASLAHNSIEAIFEDHAKVLWIATLGGVCKLDLKPKKFHQSPPNPNDWDNIQIGALYEDSTQDLWVGTYGGGLKKLSKTGKTTTFSPLSTPALPSRNIVDIFAGNQNDLWLCTLDGGLLKFKDLPFSVAQFTHDAANNRSISSNRVRAGTVGPDGAVWLATDNGLNRMNPEDFSFSHSGTKPEYVAWGIDGLLHNLHFDRHDRLWLAGQRGLKVLNASQSDTWQPPGGWKAAANLTSIPVYSIHEDYRGQIWLGSVTGLYNIDTDTGEIKIFTQAEGLSSNTILSILEDSQTHLWLATDRGITRFNSSDGVFRNFDTHDGLISSAFNRNASHMNRMGKLFFGGRRGFTSFYPNQVFDNPFIPEIALTEIRVLNKTVLRGGKTLDLKSFSSNFADNMITFQFAALDYTMPEKNQFKYRLKGFKDDWVYAGTKTSASYTNLNPGNYTFQVHGSNNDLLWNEQGLELKLTIVPPWYQTIWAFLGFGFLAASVLVALPFWRIRLLQRQRGQLSRQIESQTKVLRERYELLEEKNQELLTLDQIVETINQEWQIDNLVELLLKQGLKLFPTAEFGSFLKYDKYENAYRFIATTDDRHKGLLGSLIERDTALSRYAVNREQLEEGVYLVKQFRELPQEHTLSNYRMPVVIMVMTLMHQDRIDAMMLYENYSQPDAFQNSDIEKLRRYRDHATSAITKANLMEDISNKAKRLNDTQQLLLENAHQAGMAEIAASVLHNVGNALNSINTSAEIMFHIGKDHPLPLLEKIAQLLDSQQHNSAKFLTEDPKGAKIPKAIIDITRSLSNAQSRMNRELEAIKKHVETLIHIIKAQQAYAELEGIIHETHISHCIEEALQIEHALLTEKKIRVVKEYCQLPPIKLSKTKFLRVMVHLITHSVEAMLNQPSRILFIRTTKSDKLVKVEIRDTGKGKTPEALHKLFHQNFANQTEQGLGLHYCATTAREMGGELQVTSNGPGQGSRFTLVLPILSDG